MKNSFSAMILAAGFGTRMLPLTREIPKPLIKIKNIVLLKNTIDFLIDLGCNKIVINTHFQHQKIYNFIKRNFNSNKIIISHEMDILDTGGGLKNAAHFFEDETVLVSNCDIFWTKKNKIDANKLIKNFQYNEECKLMLVRKKNAYGLNNKKGDFKLNNNILDRWEKGNEIIYFSGLQIINLNILENINIKKFSFNKVWDLQIKKNSLYGDIMKSDWYHVGDLMGLNQAIKSIS